MNYKYTFRLSPSRQKSNILFTKHAALINEAVDAINGGISFNRDRKRLTLVSIDEKEIVISLASYTPLANPSRSLSGLTRYLVSKYSGIFEPFVYNKTLFNIQPLSQEAAPIPQDDSILSNEEVMKALIDLLYTYPNTKEVRDAKAKIVEILRPFVKRKS